MSIHSYYDFDLWFLHDREPNYQVLLINSPAGQARNIFTLPFGDKELQLFYARVAMRGPFGLSDLTPKQLVEQMGARLFDSVFCGNVLDAYRRSFDKALYDGVGLRLRLRLTDVPELGDLPWETMFDPSRQRFLSLSKETPILRFLNLPEPIKPLSIKPPLNILVVTSNPIDTQQLDFDGEWELLRNALQNLESMGKVSLERLKDPTIDSLMRRLRVKSYNMLHFIGFGGFDEEKDDGFITLGNERGTSQTINSDTLSILLRDESALRVVVLETGETARTSKMDPFRGLSSRLVLQGIPSVVGMQFQITDRASIDFSSEFYRAVADGYPVDAAVNEGRRAIYMTNNPVEWVTPVLFMRSPDGIVFTDLRPT